MERDNTSKIFNTVEEAIEDLRQGKIVIIADDEDRENEGDLVVAGEYATPEIINFMSKYGKGLICLSLTEERCKELDLNQMVEKIEKFKFQMELKEKLHFLKMI